MSTEITGTIQLISLYNNTDHLESKSPWGNLEQEDKLEEQ